MSKQSVLWVVECVDERYKWMNRVFPTRERARRYVTGFKGLRIVKYIREA